MTFAYTLVAWFGGITLPAYRFGSTKRRDIDGTTCPPALLYYAYPCCALTAFTPRTQLPFLLPFCLQTGAILCHTWCTHLYTVTFSMA